MHNYPWGKKNLYSQYTLNIDRNEKKEKINTFLFGLFTTHNINQNSEVHYFF